MNSKTISTKEFDQIFQEAAQAANKGPVFVTEQGKTAFVLLNFADYQRLIREHRNMAELLSVPDIAASIEFDPPRSQETARAADFS
ncbi:MULTISPECIES: type II toxin-antitoxin system Phd/YefM family antitoxin [unclassified Duganella]|uniref:type II toxin-antitoxin system Phd/YefM family antitoxin n=1 Tax=unclassified Duganella TaxID=2636909 RepID=UPI0008902AC1|nr:MULTISPECIES: type II toxin-antitoxin system Phd/YefM family antitoxin [unclassified Duganella]SDG03604.1 Antitoxin Phd_YefM, type II toxin-antitoxin system [Duganella sp. OV458]SDJ01726.1 Antitoxin Phd_YefM, type II toxin-antitoxin system [Duganella sp. OV510]